jgi:hypothetical protein
VRFPAFDITDESGNFALPKARQGLTITPEFAVGGRIG